MEKVYYILEDLSLQDELWESIDFERVYRNFDLLDLGLYYVTEIPDEDYQNDSTDMIDDHRVIKYDNIKSLLNDFIFNNLDIFQMNDVLDRLYSILSDGNYYIIEKTAPNSFTFIEDDIILDFYTELVEDISNKIVSDDDKKTVDILVQNIKNTFGNNNRGFILFRFNDGEVDIRDVEKIDNEVRLKSDDSSESLKKLIQHLFYHSPVVITTRILTPDKIDGSYFQEVYSYIIGIKKGTQSEFICINIKAIDILNSYEVSDDMKFEIYCDLSGDKIMGYDII